MKRILCLMLCFVFLSLSLVSCGDEEIGSYKENYPQIDNTVPTVTLNMYVIVEDATVANAITTVKRMFAQETLSKFSTTVNLVYCTKDEYNDKMMAAVNATDATAANIVLVNGAPTMDALVATNKLADLTAYVDDASYGFGSLNKTVPETLMAASKINGKYLAIPNNHVIGKYEYLIINKAAAQACGYDENVVEFLDADDPENAALTALSERMTQNGYNVSESIKRVSGNYESRLQYQKDYFCLELSYPTVTRDEAFTSAFAVVNRGELENLRAMEIIYAINSDETIKNLLQYGVRGTNYNIVNGDVVRVTDADNVYHMDKLYTGNQFIAYYCSEINWTAAAKQYGIEQNKASVLP